MSLKFIVFLCFNFVISFCFVISSSLQRPNVIIFVADDLGWDDIGFHGSTQIKTPNIDALAADGIVLDNYYVASVCTPSRGALLSGIHPIHSTTQNYVILTAEPRGLPLDIKLMPEYLNDYGYKSHIVGKWHLGFYKKEYTPTLRGFDSHVGYWAGAEDYYDHTALEDTTSWGLDFRHDLQPITNASGIYSTHYFTARSLKVIEDHNVTEPLFLYVSYQAVHGANHYAKLQAPAKYVNQFPNIVNKDRRIFAGMLLAMDESIGIIFNKLQLKGMLENSIVIFTSDNGGPASGFSGNVACNWPLRGTKAALWEGGVRVPAVLWSKLLSTGPYVSNHLMHISDWLPTLLTPISQNSNDKLTGSAERPIYGMSLWNALSNRQPSPRREVLLNIDPIWNVSAIRDDRYKLVQGLVYPKWAGWYPPFTVYDEIQGEVPNDNRHLSLDTSLVFRVLKQLERNVKPVKHYWSSKVKCGPRPLNATTNCAPQLTPCLFDLISDPCEYNNIADEMPEIAERLWKRILYHNSTAGPVGRESLDPDSWPPAHNYLWTYWQDEPI